MPDFSGLDPWSIFVTVIALPLLVSLGVGIRRGLKAWGSFGLEGVHYYFNRYLIHSMASRLSLKRYCRLQLAGRSRLLTVPAREDFSLETDRVFVPLVLAQHGSRASYTHNDFMQVGNRIRVIGDPGSGKSSLVKRVLRDECRHALSRPSDARLPILLEPKNIEIPRNLALGQLGDWFYDYIRSQSTQAQVYRISDTFDNYATNAGLLILLDGLDEVATPDYARTKAAINGLSRTLSQHEEHKVVILTMRTQFHLQVKDDFIDEFGYVMSIDRLSNSDVYEFLTRWPFEPSNQGAISRIYADLTDRPTRREMCRNPLVLAMYVAQDQVGGDIKPDTRTEFYAQVTEELIVKRRFRQTGEITARTKLQEQREQVLGNLAYYHLMDSNQPLDTLSWQDGLRAVQEVSECGDAEAALILRELSVETGLITEERVGETLRFIHLSFCEYLAALEAVEGQENGWSSLLEAHKSFSSAQDGQVASRLVEVLPFAARFPCQESGAKMR